MKTIFIASIAMAMLVGANSANALLFQGHNYEVIEFQEKTWDDATADMQSKLGSDYHLATITSEEEQDFIQGTLLKDLVGGYWLGGYQPLTEPDSLANWKWVTDETWNYTNWASGEPNDWFGVASEQYLSVKSTYGWQWNDEGNLGVIRGYIAETPAPVPEPATMLLFGTGIAGLAGFSRRKKN